MKAEGGTDSLLYRCTRDTARQGNTATPATAANRRYREASGSVDNLHPSLALWDQSLLALEERGKGKE